MQDFRTEFEFDQAALEPHVQAERRQSISMTALEFKTAIGCKTGKSAERRRPVIKPAFGTKIRRGNNHRDGKDGRPRWLKRSESGNWSRPLQRVAKKVLPLGIRRLGFHGCHFLVFRTQYRETSRKAYRERADG